MAEPPMRQQFDLKKHPPFVGFFKDLRRRVQWKEQKNRSVELNGLKHQHTIWVPVHPCPPQQLKAHVACLRSHFVQLLVASTMSGFRKEKKKKLDFHEMCHESQTALDWALRNKDKVKFKHLGNQFAINSWQQQVILPLANTLCYRRNCFSPLHPSPSPTHTHEPQVDCAVMLTGEENCFLTFPVINLHPEAWDWFHFSVYM